MNRLLLFVIISFILIISCQQKELHGSTLSESSAAKAMLQGIWIDEETEEVSFCAKGDTLFFSDAVSLPSYFCIVGDSLFVGDKHYAILKQSEHSFWFVNQLGDVIKLIKSSDDIHELNFEQTEDGLKVVFRQSGEIFDKGTIPQILNSAFVSKLKVLSNLDPSVCEIPQLGKLCFKVDNTILIASVSSFPTIMGERISLKIYKPPKTLDKILTDEKQKNILLQAAEKPGIILVCGSPLSGKTHIIYSLLMEIDNRSKNVMTIESIAKYELKYVHQCELNENIGFNIDKALRFVEFQQPDLIYLEGIKTREAFEFLSELYYNDKTVITEFMANNMTDLRQKLSFEDFQSFKNLISCLVFIHSRDSIEVFDKETLKKYLA